METSSRKSLGISPDKVLSDKAVMEYLPGVPMDYVTGPPGNNANEYVIPLGIAFKNYPNHLDLTRIGIDYVVKDDVAYLRTSNNIFGFTSEDIKRNGLGFNRDDFHHEGWVAATEKPDGSLGNGGIEYIQKPEFRELTVANFERQPDPVMNKFVTDLIYSGPLNELGIRLSQAETLRQDWNTYLHSPEAIELALKQSENAEDVTYIGVTSRPSVIYSIGGLINGKIRLSTGTRAYEYMSKKAEIFGLKLEDMIISDLGEEDVHRFRKSYDKNLTKIDDRVTEERLTKEERYNLYNTLFEDSESNQSLRERYGKVLRAIEHDIKTVERYRDPVESGRGSNRIKAQKLVLMAEAYEKGFLTYDEVNEYVEQNLRDENIESKYDRSVLEKILDDPENSELREAIDNLDTEGLSYSAVESECSEYQDEVASEESGETADASEAVEADSGSE